MHEELAWVEFSATKPLSEESAASVREAALAIVRHGIRYLPVVDGGTLVGIVAVQRVGRSGRSSATRRP